MNPVLSCLWLLCQAPCEAHLLAPFRGLWKMRSPTKAETVCSSIKRQLSAAAMPTLPDIAQLKN